MIPEGTPRARRRSLGAGESVTTEQASWWSKNWKWAVPCGCTGLVLAGALFVGVVLVGAMSLLRSSDAFEEALALARGNQEVVTRLGEPIEPGWLVSGSIETSGPSGEAALSIPLSGPRGGGTLVVEAEKRRGAWVFHAADVLVDGETGSIDLLADREPPDG